MKIRDIILISDTIMLSEKEIKNLISDIDKNNDKWFVILDRVLSEEEIKFIYDNSWPFHKNERVIEDGKFIYYWPNWEKY